jgi:putative transposase
LFTKWPFYGSRRMTVTLRGRRDTPALARFGKPEIFNTDQGSQFTSAAFTGTLEAAGIRISMDGRGRWMDNVFIERLWRSLKHEEVYLKHYADGREARAGIAAWVAFYNAERRHQALGYRTPMTVVSSSGHFTYRLR